MIRGVFEFDIEGKKRGFKFGTYGISIACKEERCSVPELFGKLQKEDLATQVSLYYGAAVHYAETNRQDIDFIRADVADWMDYLGVEKLTEITIEGLRQYKEKNGKAPMTEGATTTTSQ